MRRIIVKPVERQSVQGRDQQTYHVRDPKTGVIRPTKRMNRKKAGNASERVIFERTEGNRLKAGMSDKVTNPFFESTIEELMTNYNLPVEWQPLLEGITKQQEITQQVKLEILAQVSPGTYTETTKTRRIPGSVFIEMGPEDTRTELERFYIILYDRANIFDDTSARGRLAIQAIYNSSLIAKTREDINPNVHHWVVVREEEEQEQQVRVDRLVNTAIAKLVMLQEQYSHRDLYRIATVLTDSLDASLVNGDANALTVETALNNYLDRDSKDAKKNSKIFIQTVDLFTGDPSQFYIHYLVREGLNRNVLSSQNGYILWHSKVADQSVYKFTNMDNLISYLYQQQERYNPQEPNLQNYFQDFIQELGEKGVQI